MSFSSISECHGTAPASARRCKRAWPSFHFFRNNQKNSLGRLGPSDTQVRNSSECDSFGFQNKIGPRAQKHDQLKRIATRTALRWFFCGLVTASTPCRFSAVTWFVNLITAWFHPTVPCFDCTGPWNQCIGQGTSRQIASAIFCFWWFLLILVF